MSLTGAIEAGLQMDVGAFMLPLVRGLDTGVGLLYPPTGEIEGGGGDLAFFGVGDLLLPSLAFCCCLHLARRFLNHTWKNRKVQVRKDKTAHSS